jgi:hypothetical protein
VAVEEALSLAAPRQMRLDHADALLLRARLQLDQAADSNLVFVAAEEAANRASDDSDAALQIARECNYAWAERDALFLMARSSEFIRATERALSYNQEAEALSDRLADSNPPPAKH